MDTCAAGPLALYTPRMSPICLVGLRQEAGREYDNTK